MSQAVDWSTETVLITGGTGSFGQRFVEVLLRDHRPKKLIVFSRDELKQHAMRVGGLEHPCLRYLIGDVRDVDRLRRAMQGVSTVVHAAALKQIPACESNPTEAVLTNIMGARHVIDAALDGGVRRVLALSTDKAANPINLYGATKLVAEKLFIQANAHQGDGLTRFSCVRYGNVLASRGSVIPLFLEQRKSGIVTVTDSRMTRFWITLDQGVAFVLRSVEQMRGGEVFVPKIPSTTLLDLVRAVAPNCQIEEMGMRPGEKLHEVLVSEDESRYTVELDDMFVIQPDHRWWSGNRADEAPLNGGFRYASNTNPQRLTVDELRRLVEGLA